MEEVEEIIVIIDLAVVVVEMVEIEELLKVKVAILMIVVEAILKNIEINNNKYSFYRQTVI